MKLGVVESLGIAEFWLSLGLPVEWVRGSFDDLMKQKDLAGIFVNPDDSAVLLPQFKKVSRLVQETGFVDFVEITRGEAHPKSYMREHGIEIFVRSVAALNNQKSAYISGSGPWAQLFCHLAIQMGFRDISLVAENVDTATDMAHRLEKTCFGVNFRVLLHSELTLQPNNGSLLVNTLDALENPEVIADLAYLNFLSLEGLVVEVREAKELNTLADEAENSKIAMIHADRLQAFREVKSFSHFPGLLPWSLDEYFEKRKSFLVK